MNRYVAEGVMRDMRKGHHILVLSVNLDAVDTCFLACMDFLHEGEGARRARGQQQIENDETGGLAMFRSIVQVRNRAVRGHTMPDIVFLDFDPNIADMDLLTAEVLFDRRHKRVIFR